MAYRLPYTMRAPCEDTEDMYLAEVPVLPGCRAWGATPEEALGNLRAVARDFIESYQEHGDELPAALVGAGEHGARVGSRGFALSRTPAPRWAG